MSGRPQPPEKLPGRPTLHGAYQRPTRSRRVRKARRRFVAWLMDGCPPPSTREQLLVSATADVMVRLGEANAYLDKVGGLVGSDGQPVGVVKVYIALLNTMRRNLEVLGLRPDATDKLPDLADYLEQKKQNGSATAPTAATPAANGNGHVDTPTDADEPQTGAESANEDVTESGAE